MDRKIVLRDGTAVPAIGQGTWYLGENPGTFDAEKKALLQGIECGMTLIDTAEMYGDGEAEELVGKVISEADREKLFIVSKVYPFHAGRDRIFTSCEDSLQRLGADRLDLYLLHWRGQIPLSETVECMEQLIRDGKILRWGVSNFDTEDMEELWSIPDGDHCMVNQVLYNVSSRGIEYDLLPWMRSHEVALMAYCPLAQGGTLNREALLQSQILREIADRHGASVAQILLTFTIRDGNTIAIPRSGNSEHAKENCRAAEIRLTDSDLELIGTVYHAPKEKKYLDMV